MARTRTDVQSGNMRTRSRGTAFIGDKEAR